MYLPPAARFPALLNLPERANIGKAINEAMKAIEGENEELRDVLYVIQFAMGWMNSHLHHFQVGETYYSLPLPGTDWEDGGEKDSRPVRLDGIAPDVKMKFLYRYDFGDSWEHDVLVEKISPVDLKMKSPACLAGKGVCPPEDVGGVWGYAEFLQAIKDPEHPEHDEYLEWAGDDFDPKAFDLEAVNKALKRYGQWVQSPRHGTRGRFPNPRRIPPPDLCYAVVVKERENDRDTTRNCEGCAFVVSVTSVLKKAASRRLTA